MTSKRELQTAEDAGWTELVNLVESLTDPEVQEPGYYEDPQVWSVKDLLAHIGNWQAEAGLVLQRIGAGTYRNESLDIDQKNLEFYQASKDLPLTIVRAECWAARTRMLVELNDLDEVDPTAEEWFVESGAEHYAEHIPRLREWIEELRSRAVSTP